MRNPVISWGEFTIEIVIGKRGSVVYRGFVWPGVMEFGAESTSSVGFFLPSFSMFSLTSDEPNRAIKVD